MLKKGKKYREVSGLLKEKELYSLKEAVSLLSKNSFEKFDASCEVHLNLGIDPKQADQAVRGTVTLPHGAGKKVKIIAFAEEAGDIKKAKDAGAVEAGSDDLINKISKGWMNFDIAVAAPPMMKKISKIAKILGQKGLMPNPKSGTVTPEIGKMIKSLMEGRIEFRNDKLANLHNIFGKISFGEEKLLENLKTYLKALAGNKPKGVKGTYIKTATVSTTMGPGIKLDPKTLSQ